MSLRNRIYVCAAALFMGMTFSDINWTPINKIFGTSSSVTQQDFEQKKDDYKNLIISAGFTSFRRAKFVLNADVPYKKFTPTPTSNGIDIQVESTRVQLDENETIHLLNLLLMAHLTETPGYSETNKVEPLVKKIGSDTYIIDVAAYYSGPYQYFYFEVYKFLTVDMESSIREEFNAQTNPNEDKKMRLLRRVEFKFADVSSYYALCPNKEVKLSLAGVIKETTLFTLETTDIDELYKLVKEYDSSNPKAYSFTREKKEGGKKCFYRYTIYFDGTKLNIGAVAKSC